MIAKIFLEGAILLVAAGGLLVGCGESGNELTKQEKAAFNGATPEIKLAWENALKADKSHDYVTASMQYRSLLSQPITPQQLAAVQGALAGLNQRMNEAAANGSESAKQAIETLQKGIRGRGR